jgi:RibD C-terminal domain
VLTHHARASLKLKVARISVRDRGNRSGVAPRAGAVIRQFLSAGLIDELHLAIAPVVLGAGEPLFAGIDAAKLGYSCTRHVATPTAMHVLLSKSSA